SVDHARAVKNFRRADDQPAAGYRGRRGGCEDRLHARGGTVLDHRGATKRQRIAAGSVELPTTLEHRPIHDRLRAQPAVSPHLVAAVISRFSSGQTSDARIKLDGDVAAG